MRDHSRLIQKEIRTVSCSDREFETTSNSRDIPIVLVPKSPFIFQVGVEIPSGCFVLWQQWLRDMGQIDPGIVWFWPSWNRISHIVTRAAITYNAPVLNCPTADNVMVDADLSVTFRIGPNVEAARNFVYRLGAFRFDELLSAEIEERIRGLVQSQSHNKLNDMKGEFALEMLTTLNNKCNQYGVQILTVKVKDIILPQDLQDLLERTTAFKTKMTEKEKLHEDRVRILEDDASKELETIRRKNARKIQEIVAERKRYEIERREMEEKARGEARVEEIRAMTEADIALKKAQGDEQVAKVKARQNAESLLKKTQIECQKLKFETEQKVAMTVKEAEAQLKIAESKSQAMVARAEAEAEGADSLAEKRRYELEWARLAVLEKIAGKGRRFISGDKGQAILNNLVPDIQSEIRTSMKV